MPLQLLQFAPYILQGALGLGKALTGAGQMATARRPGSIKYEIPSGFIDYLTQTDVLARSGLPGEDIARERLGSQVAGAIGDVTRSADSSASALGGTVDIYKRSIDAIADLALRSAEYRANMMQRSAQAQRELGMYQDKAWEYNVNIPYQREMNEFWNRRQAGMNALWGGLDTMGSAAVSGYSSWQQRQFMDELINSIKGIPYKP